MKRSTNNLPSLVLQAAGIPNRTTQTTGTIIIKYVFIKALIEISNLVGQGRGLFISINIAVMLGTTTDIRNTTTATATTIIIKGYATADLTLAARCTRFSSISARRRRTSSRVPLVSPAATILTNRLEKTFGCLLSASASVLPELTSLATCSIISASGLFLARTSRNCSTNAERAGTRGIPARSSVAN